MTTLIDPCSYREWRVNRLQQVLGRVSLECGNPRLTRTMAQSLARDIREIGDEIADMFVCPICGHPGAEACTECPVGSLTARPGAAFRSTHASE